MSGVAEFVFDGVLAKRCPDWVCKDIGVPLYASRCGQVFADARSSTVERVRKGQAQVFSNSRPRQRLSQSTANNGYFEVCVAFKGRRKKFLVHRLVASAWVSGYADGLSVNHINGTKTDNRAENLEWVSLAQNTQHQWETGLVDLRGEAHPDHKLSSRRVVYIRRLLARGATPHELAIIADITPTMVYRIRDGKAWTGAVEEH